MRAEKTQMIRDISDMLNETNYVYFISYKGLSVDKFSELRSKLHKNESECHVLKNRLIKKASELHGPEKIKDIDLKDDTAVVIGKGDAGAVAKIISEFSKTNEAVASKGGYFEGEVLAESDIKAIADLPSKEVLQAQLIGVIQAPARNLVTALNMAVSGIVNVLNAYKNKLEQE